jgi:hypothetical protein
LTIEESGNTRYATVVGQNDGGTVTSGGQRNIQQIENEIARLDREWTIAREQYKIHGRYTSKLPSNNTVPFTIIVAILAIGFVGFWLNGVSSMQEKAASYGHDHNGTGSIFLLFGVVMIIGVIINSVINVNKSSGYEAAKRTYENKRAALLKRLN